MVCHTGHGFTPGAGNNEPTKISGERYRPRFFTGLAIGCLPGGPMEPIETSPKINFDS